MDIWWLSYTYNSKSLSSMIEEEQVSLPTGPQASSTPTPFSLVVRMLGHLSPKRLMERDTSSGSPGTTYFATGDFSAPDPSVTIGSAPTHSRTTAFRAGLAVRQSFTPPLFAVATSSSYPGHGSRAEA